MSRCISRPATLLAVWSALSPVMAADPVAAVEALFPLDQVRLLDGPLRTQQELNRRYLLKLEPDRMLSRFRSEAGLEPAAPPYRGWESEGRALPGHILGFYLSGAAMTVQATGDAVLRERLGFIVDQLADVQAANGSGYLLAAENGKQVFRGIAEGNIRIDGLPWNGYQVNGSFAPVYTLNKLLLGLARVHEATGNDKARQVFLKLADWFGTEIVDRLDDERLQTLMQCEHGSLPESFADAWRFTGDAKYLGWARRLCHERMLGPLADGRGGFLTRFHANSNIPKYTGFERVHQATGEPPLHAAAVHFWDEVVDHRSWVIGGNSVNEHFFDPADFGKSLAAAAGPETCNSVNMLRLTEALFMADPAARKMDFYERVLFNHVLAAHDPERAMTCYYTTMRPGGYRVYSDEFDSMWCCTATGLEVPGTYARMIFSHAPDDSALEVNLFAAAALDWKSRGVRVVQSTGFPHAETSALAISCDRPGTRFTLRIRHPGWVPAGRLALAVNGVPAESTSLPGAYAALDRAWNTGDTVTIGLPMHLSSEPLPGDDHHTALLYGPIVLSGELGRGGGLVKEDFWQIHTTVGTKPLPASGEPVLIADTAEEIPGRLRAVPGEPLHFTTGDLLERGELRLRPFFENHFQRYAIYWPRLSRGEAAAAAAVREAAARALAETDARTVDRVLIGRPDSEKLHAFAGEKTRSGTGPELGGTPAPWRDARDGGWFSYDLAVDGTAPQFLRCTYWGREAGARAFDLSADGALLETRSLGDAGKDDFLHIDVPLPADLVAGKTKIRVKFQAHPGNAAGGLFDLRVVKSGG